MARTFTFRVHAAAIAALRNTARSLEPYFGPFLEDDEGWTYSPLGTVRLLRLTWRQRSKFLGGVYSCRLVVDMATDLVMDEDWRLHYDGILFKGRPEFRPARGAKAGLTDSSAKLRDALHADHDLLESLANQDIEDMTLASGPEHGTVRMCLTPIGGGFVWMMLPPLKYSVRLPSRHGLAMVQTVQSLARVFQTRFCGTGCVNQGVPHGCV